MAVSPVQWCKQEVVCRRGGGMWCEDSVCGPPGAGTEGPSRGRALPYFGSRTWSFESDPVSSSPGAWCGASLQGRDGTASVG